MKKTIVYIDGFNLYYALKKYQAKWLDIELLCKKLLTQNEIIYGHFLTSKVWMVKASDEQTAEKVQVIKTEEKGSDVNIATHLLIDAFQNNFEVAAVMTNDSDLKLPIRLTKQVLNKTIGVLCPHETPSRELIKVPSFFKSIKKETFLACQYPDKLQDRNGVFKKPPTW